MCGRTGLSINQGTVRQACCYKSPKSDTYKLAEWFDEYNMGKEYIPSYNIAPTDITPVMIGLGDKEYGVKPMMWGMVPFWHKGDYRSHGLSTNNCRIENILTSKLYSEALRKGNRCVVIAEGFYEWQTTDKSAKTKQPYYIYMKQNDKLQIDDVATWNNHYSEASGWSGINLLKMAALYNTWSDSEGNILYSYSIITLESNDTLNWLHHRMPAVLDSDHLIWSWLNCDEIPPEQAVSMLKPVKQLSWHPVSTFVNNSRNKSNECNKRITINKNASAINGSAKFMAGWLSRKRKFEDDKQN